MILEYQNQPCYEQQADGHWRVTSWNGVVSVDLRYVAKASPSIYPAGYTLIVHNGGSDSMLINVDYDKFMRDWRSVKR